MQDKSKEEKLIQTAEKLGVDLVLLFGSRADGSNRSNSDFDIAYRSALPIDTTGELFDVLAKYYNSDNLQIVRLNTAKPLFLFEILNNCKVLYAKDKFSFYNLRDYAIKRYYDEVKPLFQMKFDRLKAKYVV